MFFCNFAKNDKMSLSTDELQSLHSIDKVCEKLRQTDCSICNSMLVEFYLFSLV